MRLVLEDSICIALGQLTIRPAILMMATAVLKRPIVDFATERNVSVTSPKFHIVFP